MMPKPEPLFSRKPMGNRVTETPKFYCKHCRAELGTMDGLRLIVVTVILSSRTPLRCVSCQR